jgi:flagellar protein FlaG
MSTTVAIPAIGPDLQGSVSTRSPTEDISGLAAGASPAASAADLRLVIEEDKAANSFVYKTVDMRTGQVVQQFPREEVLRLKGAPDYRPGAVINARG